MKRKTLAHEFLDIEAEDFEVPQSCYDTLDDVIAKAEESIDVEDEPEVVLESIGRVLEEYGFNPGENGKISSLSHGLYTKEIDCKDYSVLYYSIGEKLGLPLTIVQVPKHVFVRWSDGKRNIDWETTRNLKSSDKYYISGLNISDEAISKGVYLESLTREQVKSIIFNDSGCAKVEKKDFDGAIADFDRAIELYPNNTLAYSNRSAGKMGKEDFDGAIADLNIAIELDPNYATAYFNRGKANAKKRRLNTSIADFDRAIELDPDCTGTYFNRGMVKLLKFRLISGIKDFITEYKLWRSRG